MKKTSVCMIAYSEYPSDARIRREAETLAANPHFAVTVIALKEGHRPRTYVMDGVRVREVNLARYRGTRACKYIAAYLAFALRAFYHCSKIFVLENVDVVHVHNMPDFLVFSALLPRLFGKKLVLDIHDSVPETFASKFEMKSAFLFWLLCKEEAISILPSNRVICVNHPQRDTLLRRGVSSGKMYVSMNVPDHKRFFLKSNNNHKAIATNAFNLVYHGTITRRLGLDILIHALAGLVPQIRCIHLHLWGDGELVGEMKGLAATLGIQERVHFYGKIPLPDLPGKLNAMDLGVVSNRRSEAAELMLPVKMMEYIALGIPVVAPRLACIQYYFSEEMVSYYDPGDSQSMQNAILRMYLDEPGRRRQGEQAREFLKRYGWEGQSQDFLNFYSDILQKG
jgi:glycosyltransferase involved in cell wall biosynthesis